MLDSNFSVFLFVSFCITALVYAHHLKKTDPEEFARRHAMQKKFTATGLKAAFKLIGRIMKM